MNLYELPDKDFDERFRMAADSAGYPFSETAWNGLEKRLNRRVRFGPWFWPFTGGSVLLVLGLVFFLLVKYPGIDEQPVTSETANQIPAGKLPVSGWIMPGEDNRDPQQEKIEKGTASGNALRDSQDQPARDRFLSDGTQPEEAGNDPDDQPLTETTVPVMALDQPEGFQGRKNVADIEENDSKLIPMHISPKLDILNKAFKREGPELSVQRLKEGPDVEAPAGESRVTPPTQGKISPGYTLNLMLGPDFSGVGANGYGTGTFAGLGFELFIGRFSLMTAVSHSRKKYSVTDEYTLPYSGNSSYGSSPERVEIACHVLDIPLNVYYSIIRSGKNRVFAGGGLSTYLMLTEEYHFNYGSGYPNPNASNDFTLKNENQHILGIINLSAGYSRSIGRKWDLQVEPYLKLPIQDIAAAKVRLNSFGAIFSLKYRIR